MSPTQIFALIAGIVLGLLILWACREGIRWSKVQYEAERRSKFQLAAFRALIAGPRDGRTLRAFLGENGIHRSGPVFYQEMMAMEEAGHVIGENVDGKRIYRIPIAGDIQEAMR